MAPTQEVLQHHPTGDANAAQHSAAQVANDAFHDQLHTAFVGKGSFLDQTDRAMGGSGVSDAPALKQVADNTNPKEKAVHDAAATLGLVTDGANAKEEGNRVSEQNRMMAFASVYGRATGDQSHSGFLNNSKDPAGSELNFNAPILNTNQNAHRQLSFA